MLGELSKLFDRTFAVGFFLPAFILFSATAFMLNQSFLHLDVTMFQELEWLVLSTVLGLLSLVGGIVLLAVNRDLYRFMEGYGTLNPIWLLGWMEIVRFRFFKYLKRTLDALCIRRYLAAGKPIPAIYQRLRESLQYSLAVEFPQEERVLLATPFGNVLRSFEFAPYVMYGIDSVSTWSRLLAIIPREYVGMIEAVKSQVDFWVNLGLVFVLLLAEYIGLVYVKGWPLNRWIVGVLFALGTLCPMRATSSAREWGDFVKSVFDLYRFELLDAMHIARPHTRDEERELWGKINRALQFGMPSNLPELKRQDPPHGESELERVRKKN